MMKVLFDPPFYGSGFSRLFDWKISFSIFFLQKQAVYSVFSPFMLMKLQWFSSRVLLIDSPVLEFEGAFSGSAFSTLCSIPSKVLQVSESIFDNKFYIIFKVDFLINFGLFYSLRNWLFNSFKDFVKVFIRNARYNLSSLTSSFGFSDRTSGRQLRSFSLRRLFRRF